jgi:hypothetical protein
MSQAIDDSSQKDSPTRDGEELDKKYQTAARARTRPAQKLD